ncbi:maleylpyruvate isomerase family mycothiol-dependent enzyme [Streptomyces syringium]|uniref:maleylpyruvate isomerase family mycothiol-dependent enzyme n=1 Tax=Streptomyces syringium TaxID=76729 RepID=UPI0033F7D439
MSSAPRKPRARSYDPAKTRAAVLAQFGHVRDVVAGLSAEQLALPTRLGDWTVRELAAHIASVTDNVSRSIEAPAPEKHEVALVDWAFATRAFAGKVDEAAHEAAAAAEPLELLDRTAARFTDITLPAPGDRLVAARVGAMRLDDLIVTRCVELIVHTDDLAAALGTAIPYDRQALATCVRLLADGLATKAPGGSVEVRIPPFAVVQCVAGPKHTRGTPPNVVETDPLTWVRLATGRTDWATALDRAAVSASGERADISAQLPLLG